MAVKYQYPRGVMKRSVKQHQHRGNIESGVAAKPIEKWWRGVKA
jgi:hypothetical protein